MCTYTCGDKHDGVSILLDGRHGDRAEVEAVLGHEAKRGSILLDGRHGEGAVLGEHLVRKPAAELTFRAERLSDHRG